MKGIIRILIILVLIVLWVVVNNELIEIASVAIAVLVIIVLAIDLAKGKGHKATVSMLFLSLIFILFAAWMHYEVGVAADEFSKQLIEKYTCRPTLAELIASGDGWERKYPSMVEKTFRMAGASRKVIYRDMGLLNYGFLYEGKRSYVFPECK